MFYLAGSYLNNGTQPKIHRALLAEEVASPSQFWVGASSDHGQARVGPVLASACFNLRERAHPLRFVRPIWLDRGGACQTAGQPVGAFPLPLPDRLGRNLSLR